MNFEHQMPEWENEGTAPSTELKKDGFKAGYKPPAGVFNWFWSLIMKAIKEIQSNLSNVDNTKDSEKNVSFASEAGVGRKVKYPFIFRLNGGNVEGTDLWNYDGSVSKSVNLTPEKLGARPTNKPNIVVNAVREETDDGKEIYVVTDSNITELYNGLEITIIPNAKNTTSSPRLKINDFEDKGIRLALSFNVAATTTVEANYFQIDRPITLKYHSALNLGIQGMGAWLFADRLKTSAQDLYGDVPIESGGTGASTKEDALANLGVSDYVIEEGNFGVWDYRKWASGKAELWGRLRPKNIETTNEVFGGLLNGYTSATVREELPFALFSGIISGKTVVPKTIVSMDAASSATICYTGVGTDDEDDEKGYFSYQWFTKNQVMFGESSSSYVDVYIYGKLMS